MEVFSPSSWAMAGKVISTLTLLLIGRLVGIAV
jgi:hypothetical protein